LNQPVDPRASAELLKAVAHPTRVMILQELLAGTKCVSDMEELLPARQANISQHLAVLRYSRLVDYAQEGGLRCYYLSRPELVRDLLALVGRGDPVVKRSADEIRKEKLDREKARSPKPALRSAAKPPRRTKVRT
jgi:ArsR family transcriptional regulator